MMVQCFMLSCKKKETEVEGSRIRMCLICCIKVCRSASSTFSLILESEYRALKQHGAPALDHLSYGKHSELPIGNMSSLRAVLLQAIFRARNLFANIFCQQKCLQPRARFVHIHLTASASEPSPGRRVARVDRPSNLGCQISTAQRALREKP